MQVQFRYGQDVGGIYRWYINKFLNTQRGLGINTIWFLSVYPPGYIGAGGDRSLGIELLRKSYNFLNSDGAEGFDEAWKYMVDKFGDEYNIQTDGLDKCALVFLLAKEVVIPGVNLDVTQHSYASTGGSGVISCPMIANARKNNDHISIEMYLTDYSFPNIILRPWIRALSIYGMTESTLRGQIVFTQMTKRNHAGAAGKWGVSNVITLKNAYPVSIPSCNMNYQGVDIDKTMSVEWGYDIVDVKNKLPKNLGIDNTKVLDSGSWGAAVHSAGGDVNEPLKDTGDHWNSPNPEWIAWKKTENGDSQHLDMYKKISFYDAGNLPTSEIRPRGNRKIYHWYGNGQSPNGGYSISKPNYLGDDILNTPNTIRSSLTNDAQYMPDNVNYNVNYPIVKTLPPMLDTIFLSGSTDDLTPQWSRIDKVIQVKDSIGNGTHDAKTGNEDTVMLNGWPFGLHHYIPAFYNLFDFLTKQPAPEPKIMGDVEGDTPTHNGRGNINESQNPNDDSTITGDIAKKDNIKTPIDDTPYRYDSLGITKLGEVPPNDSNITGDIEKKVNEKVVTPDTPGSRLTVPIVRVDIPTDDHVNGKVSYGHNNIIIPTDDHVGDDVDVPHNKVTPTDDVRNQGESTPYIERLDSEQDSVTSSSNINYKDIRIQPQGIVSSSELQSFVPRETTNGPDISKLYTEVDAPENDFPIFANVAHKILGSAASSSSE